METLTISQTRDIIENFHKFDQKRISHVCNLLYFTKIQLGVQNAVNLNSFGANPMLVLTDAQMVLGMLEKDCISGLRRSLRSKDIFGSMLSIKPLLPDLNGRDLMAACKFLIEEKKQPDSVAELRHTLNLPEQCGPIYNQHPLDSEFESDNLLSELLHAEDGNEDTPNYSPINKEPSETVKNAFGCLTLGGLCLLLEFVPAILIILFISWAMKSCS
jgi:hypothetical protein